MSSIMGPQQNETHNNKTPKLVELRDRQHRRNRAVAALGVIVVIATAMTLMVPAISMTRTNLVAGTLGHEHTDACYEKVLVCDQEGVEGHEHTVACYENKLTCGMEEYTDPNANADAKGESGEAGSKQSGDASDKSASGEAASDAADSKANSKDSSVVAGNVDDQGLDSDSPAQSFEASLKDKEDNTILTVSVDAPEGALPANSSMTINKIDADKLADKVDAALSYDPELKDKAQAKRTLAVNVTFADADGNEIEPAAPVKAKMSSINVKEHSASAFIDVAAATNAPEDLVVVHVLDAKKARMANKLDEKGDPKKAEIVDNVVLANWDDDNDTKGSEDALKLNVEEAGPYAIVELAALEPGTIDESATDDAEEEAPVASSNYPAQQFDENLVGADGNVTLNVKVDAPEGALPENAKMQLTPVTKESVLDAVKDAAAAETDIDAKRAEAIAVDITFFDADGKMVEPLADVHVKMTAPAIAQETSKNANVNEAVDGSGESDKGNKTANNKTDNTSAAPTDLAVVHVVDAETTEVVETTDLDVASAAAEFDSADFSVYALVYTVDFHWEVDGKTYEFSIPGGGYVTLQQLVEVLGIANGEAADKPAPEAGENDTTGAGEGAGESGVAGEGTGEKADASDADAVAADVGEGAAANDGGAAQKATSLNNVKASEATKAFVADVASAEFSNQELAWVGKAENEATIGALKETNKLDCQYSAELTEDQIAEINAQTVEAGDWALISLKPFKSEESLVVTLKTGEVFTIKVTDAQIKKTVISKSGETWEITVTYGPDAQIPDGAELRVKEIQDEDEEYAKLQESIAENLEQKNEIPPQPMLFDISIWANDQEIEPAKGSEVKVEIKLVKDSVKGMFTDDESPLIINGAPITENEADLIQTMQVIHQLDEGGVEVMETTDSISEGEVRSTFMTDSFSNWLLYLDEEFENNEITVYVGDSITLRPYGEWYWKKNDQPEPLSTWDWRFPGTEYTVTQGTQTVSTDYQGHTETYSGITRAVTNNGKYTFTGTARYDRELKEYYWFYNATLDQVGELYLHIGTESSDVKTIKVNVVPKPADDDGKPGTVQGLSNIKVNLFDYDNSRILDAGPSRSWNYWGNHWDYNYNDLNHNLSSGPYDNTVNNGHSLKFLSSGSGGSNGLNGYTNQYSHQGLVQDTLPTTGNNAGFPSLTSNYGGDSLKYLFDTSDTSWGNDDAVIAYPDVEGLFQLDDEGYYYYNSNMNYAYYDPSNGNKQVTLYEHTYTQNTSGSGVNAKPIGFFPFHDYDSGDDLYVNQNTDLNHHFGMSMQVKFTLPDNKLNNNNHIIYEFSGDDDLWVFVDGQLVLDIGGIHQPVRGYIDFTDGNVYVYGVNGSQPQIIPFVRNLASDTKHTLDMFYIERGGCDSNLSVKFNLPLVVGEAHFTKNGEVLNADGTVGSHELPGAGFSLYDNIECTGEPLYTAVAGEDGVVHFDNIVLGTYYMKETTVPPGYSPNLTLYKVEILEDITHVNAYNKVYAQTGEAQWVEITETTNTKEKTSITVSKNWVNAGGTTWPENISSVQIGLCSSVDGGDPTELSGKKCTLDAEHTSYTFDDLLKTDNDNKPITYSVIEKTVTLSDNTVVTPEEAGITVAISGVSSGQPVVTNTVKPDLALIKVDKNKHATKLSGAEFILEKKNADGDTWSNITASMTINKQDGTAADRSQAGYFVVPQDGVVLVGLDAGEYRVVEKVSPAGYITIADPAFSFTVENGLVKNGNDTITSAEIEMKLASPFPTRAAPAPKPSRSSAAPWLCLPLRSSFSGASPD